MARTMESFEIPPEMRVLAEKSVEQARQAFDNFMSAAERTLSAIEGPAETARKGARGLGDKAMTFAARNIASSFEFAETLVRAKTVEELLKLQADYIKTQMEVLAEQAKELGTYTSRIAKDAAQAKH